MDKRKNIAFYTLGCKLNYSESDTIARNFDPSLYKRVPFGQDADIFIINTCSVTASAEAKCRNVIRRAKKLNSDAIIVTTGCYAQLQPNFLENTKIPGLVINANDKFKIDQIFEGKNETVSSKNNNRINEIFYPAYSLEERTRSYLKIQDGCDYFCSYCTIPLARGKSRSSSIKDVIKTVKLLISQDVKEIVLTGVNVGEFGHGNNESLIELLNELENINSSVRYRISSIEPNLLTDDIIKLVAKSDKIAPHFHIPLQSGSDNILKSMRRRYNSILFESKVDQILNEIPNCCIGVDVITGFPGETNEDFKKTYNLLDNMNISYLHVFPYSERPKTTAIKLNAKVSKKFKKQRAEMLRSLSDEKKKVFYKLYEGRQAKVLFESVTDNEEMIGFTANYIRTKNSFVDKHLLNKLVDVQLTTAGNDGIMSSKLLYINHHKL